MAQPPVLTRPQIALQLLQVRSVLRTLLGWMYGGLDSGLAAAAGSKLPAYKSAGLADGAAAPALAVAGA